MSSVGKQAPQQFFMWWKTCEGNAMIEGKENVPTLQTALSYNGSHNLRAASLKVGILLLYARPQET